MGKNLQELVDLAITTTLDAANIILKSRNEFGEIESVILSGKETKIIADQVLDKIILDSMEEVYVRW